MKTNKIYSDGKSEIECSNLPVHHNKIEENRNSLPYYYFHSIQFPYQAITPSIEWV